MKKFLTLFFSVILCSSLLFSGICLADESSDTAESISDSTDPSSSADIDIHGGAAVVADLTTGRMLYFKNPDQPLYPASLTKIMTALIALDNTSLSDIVTVNQSALDALESGSMRMGVVAGQELTMEEALYALLISSANDIANAIAEHISGSADTFTELMNQYAQNLGCTQTHFANPTGLDADGVSTSAADMAIICMKAAQNDQFLKICGAPSYTVSSKITPYATDPRSEDDPYILYNQHLMISGDFPYEYAYAGKTGYTNLAQMTLATYARKDDMNLLCIILNCPYDSETYAYEDTQTLLDYCFENFDTLSEQSSRTLLQKDETTLTINGNTANASAGTDHNTAAVSEDAAAVSPIDKLILGHSWRDYALAAAILIAGVLLLILIIRQLAIYIKRRRRRKKYEQLKKARLEREHEETQTAHESETPVSGLSSEKQDDDPPQHT